MAEVSELLPYKDLGSRSVPHQGEKRYKVIPNSEDVLWQVSESPQPGLIHCRWSKPETLSHLLSNWM